MRFDSLVPGAPSSVEVTRVDIDSRTCQPGSLFFALPGAVADGADHVGEAVRNGAVAVVSWRAVETTVPVMMMAPNEMIPALASASAAVVGHPEQHATLVGVTGTNGKTSVVTMVASLCRSLGWPAASIGTLTGARTTPAAPDLFRSLAASLDGLSGEGRPVLAMEVSSHALDQRRVEGLHFAVGAFTNLSHDHLDYHGDMESYFAAKARLFEPGRCESSVVWVDDPYGARLAGMASGEVIPVGRSDAGEVRLGLDGSRFVWRGIDVASPLLGSFNVDNLLVALAVVSRLGASDDNLAAAVTDLTPVPGRFDVVRGTTTVIVDYAHTPDGLRRLLTDVRALAPTSTIVTVFGCGGDRDREKRPLMGAIAEECSDYVIVTSDNPRSEDPNAIMDDVLSGITNKSAVVREPDRRAAIARALAVAGTDDVVVVAGKGHESTQTIGTTVSPFDDRLVVRELMGAPC